MAALAWFAIAAGALLIYSARKGTSPVETLRAVLSGESAPSPVYVIEGLGETAGKGVGLADGAGKGTGTLTRPVPGAITSGFGMRNGRMHYGVDIPEPTGTPIRAAMAGEVSGVGYDLGAGNFVRVSHPNGWLTKYFHMSSIAATKGKPVSAGQIIGYVGSTGRSSGPHLHFELWIDGKAVDAKPYLDGQARV